ncbi:threonine--tRNA ligase [Thermus sp.]|uniref:threonine--tRNA ligase n=1 Tax=Thermus sp. TaxID=275 RepID=UPI0025DF8A2B|nr:threonine--tRNA ligase [Thermus sp.]MCS6868001.1 threonine--tRNA ligase [Thermus sp.]MCX7848673.1 threonine--tRNA ligase [Thermus sp.]MDW8016912.1 threonine--tRNA ligase [Thermus sp.]MDW8357093.1 threonine--tRNA ligase [Thermus sp.]
MTVYLPDGKALEVQEGATARDVAQALGPRLAQKAVGAIVNGELYDLLKPLPPGASVRILTEEDPEYQTLFRHTLAHVLAQAVKEHFQEKGYDPESVKLGVGPVIEKGFYYDIDAPEPLSDEDLPALEARMRAILAKDLPLRRYTLPREAALARYQGKDPYKTELIQELPEGEEISFYQQGDEAYGFTDLCRGPHVPSTGRIPPHFRLTHVAGAYWRGDERRPMLQRVYGVAFRTAEELKAYLWQLEEAKRRDHRRLGRELELFLIDPMVGKGLVLWLPKGNTIREELIAFMREEQLRRGYQLVTTPHIGGLELYKTSGHYPYYAESQFPPMRLEDREGSEEYLLKPMNCPHHIRIYAHKKRSYRELPLRIAEFGTVYRYEKAGELLGLTRVRGFTQDDAHLFCTPEQVKEEFLGVLDLVLKVFATLGLKGFRARIGVRDPQSSKYVGEEAKWALAERQIEEAAREAGLDYTLEEGDAAFYGPKLDFVVKDALGREWQLGTIQVDYNLPERFQLTYVGKDGQEHRPVMIHRAPFGSLERFIGILIEHFAGDFPLWLSPVQAVVVPVSEKQEDYAKEVVGRLKEAGLRAEGDLRPERMQARIRDAEVQKVPYILVVGERERAEGTVSVRRRHRGNLGTMPLATFLEGALREYRERKLEPVF